MRNIFILFKVFFICIIFAGISYAESGDNESHEDKVHIKKNMENTQKQKKGLKISKNTMLQLCQTILCQTGI